MARLNGAFELSHCIRKAAWASAANLWRKEFRNCPRFYNAMGRANVAMLWFGAFHPYNTNFTSWYKCSLNCWAGHSPHIFCSKCQLGTACQTQQQQNKWGRTGENQKIVYNSTHCEFNLIMFGAQNRKPNDKILWIEVSVETSTYQRPWVLIIIHIYSYIFKACQ